MIPAMISPRGQKDDMRKLCALITGMAAVAALSTAAQAKTVEFVSPHPVPHKFGGGFCHIDAPHVHNYPPDDVRLFRESHGRHYFVGDPTPFGYDGPRYSYYGAHPVAEAELRLGHSVYCYIKGPHYHWYQPPAQAQFELSGGAYWYIGAFPPAYYDERPRYAVVNDAYAPVLYTRPVVNIEVAPAVVRADISLGGPGWHAHALVGGPPAPVVVAPAPVVVAPAPVVVAPAPAPVQIGVGINLGGPPAIVEGPYHHDHGHRDQQHYQERPRRATPARFIVGPAPVKQPLLQRATPHSQSPLPRIAPTPTRAPAPAAASQPAVAPARSPAPAQRRVDQRPERLR
jgi:hypothetical protein